MPERIVPESFRVLLGVLAGCFGASSYRNFELLVVGWVHCLGRRTITAVVLGSTSALMRWRGQRQARRRLGFAGAVTAAVAQKGSGANRHGGAR